MKKTVKSYYDPNHPYYVERSIAKTERKLKELHIRAKLFKIETRLKALSGMQVLYPPHRADDEQPSAVHIPVPLSS